MNPSVEDRLLAKGARFGEWWTLERLHEAFEGISSSKDSQNNPCTQGDQRPDLSSSSPAA